MTRREVLNQAVEQCMKELYSYAVPHVEWNDFIQQNKDYIKKEKEYNRLKHKLDFYGHLEPKPFEFYYLPKKILKDICDSYIDAYKLDEKQEFLNIIKILKEYCQEPIVEKYNEETKNREYERPDNLEKELQKIFDDKILPDICKQYNKQYNLQTTGIQSSVSKAYAQIFQDKFFEFLDMAGKFYNWTNELNTFNMNVYLGASPNSNKQAVIDNWKKWRNKDIKIDEEQIKKEYYGKDFDE